MIDLVGKNLGQYQIIEEIGSGGMATVYKAYQPGLDRFVAIKVLPPQHAMAEGYEQRFFREARAVAQLNHPNILPIYDVGIEDDISYFVMKYVPGRTLGDLMGQPMSLERVSRFIEQIAGALDHAHGRGILHRDIKPANMLLDEDDWLLLADFGLAKIVEGSEHLTSTGMSMGTPSYASPEQVEGMEVDRRTDIYSLGIVLFQMATGQLPYHGNTPMSVMFKHVHEELPNPRLLNPNLPETVEQIIRKATAKNVADRYERAGEMAADLRRCLQGEVFTVAAPDGQKSPETVVLPDDSTTPNPAPATSDPYATMMMRDKAPKRPNRNLLIIGAVAALVIIGVIGLVAWQFSGQSNDALARGYEDEFKNAPNPEGQFRALIGLFELGDHSRTGRELFNSLSDEEKLGLFENIVPEARPKLSTVIGGVYSYLGQNEADNQLLATMQAALSRSGEAENKNMASEIENWLKGRAAAAAGNYQDAEIAYSVAIGLNNQNPATYFERGLAHLALNDYPQALADFETVAQLNSDWNPQLAQTIEGNYDLHLALWEVRERYPTITALISRPADTATPTSTATQTPTITPSPTTVPTDTPTATPTPQPTATPSPSPSPTATTAAAPLPAAERFGDTYQLAFTKYEGQHNLYVIDTNGENEQFLLSRAAGPSWSPNGNFIYFYGEPGVDRQNRGGVDYVFEGIGSGIVRLNANPLPVNVDQIQLFQASRWNEGSARWASVSPGGQAVAYDARPGGGYRIYFIGIDQPPVPFEIVGEQGDWSPDGQKLVYRSGRDGKTGIWISNWNDTGHTNLTNDGSDSFPAWSPDGETIAFSRDSGGNIDIYTINADGANLQRLTETPGPDTLPTFTPDGDIIFRSARGSGWGIWKMTRTGGLQTEILANAPVGPDWAYSKMDVK